jgi:hypothetical protein
MKGGWIPASAGMTAMSVTPAKTGAQAAVSPTAGHGVKRSSVSP